MASEGPPRLPAFVSTSAMLILSVAVLLSVEQIRPVVRELQRDTAVERAAVRQLAGHLARAVRDLAGRGCRPAPHRVGLVRAWDSLSRTAAPAPVSAEVPGGLCRPREALLNLPPPATC
jgi:hypothetical protein